MVDLVSFLRARLDDDQHIAEAATQGHWSWAEPSADSWPVGDEPLLSSQNVWEKCPYYCTWSGPSEVHRGESGKPGHEHRRSVEVVGSWGHDAYGLSADDADKRHIVTWQPSRVLAEVAAKRAILDLHAEHAAAYPDECAHCYRNEDAVNTIRLLAQPFRDHPDFDPAWTEET